ncbi:MAG: sigma-54-dependent Fis family transcriptional regulator [Chitinophagaceae bacterium]|nr:MAG: sigma-54-dependent Fis family transcriptional regulator [Chitinophagaceae bacterium]
MPGLTMGMTVPTTVHRSPSTPDGTIPILFPGITGNSDVMKEVFVSVRQVAGAVTTILLLGETGTGKELIAGAIHSLSPRAGKPMVRINCASVPPTLIESELFGHEKGSFTGATDRRIGKFEQAQGGTLFLDEIGEIPLQLQSKLLHVIQEKEIERIGSNIPVKIDVRIIAATNRDLAADVADNRFRGDLYYRLNVFPIHLPPLRERKEDIPVLLEYFVGHFCGSTNKGKLRISPAAIREAVAYSWPGNIRELGHLAERAVLSASENLIRRFAIPGITPIDAGTRLLTHEENEREHIRKVLKACSGKISGPGGAASILQLKTSTLNSKIKKLGIVVSRSFR